LEGEESYSSILVLQNAVSAFANEEELSWATAMVLSEAATELRSASEVQVRGDLLYLPDFGQQFCGIPETHFIEPFLGRAEVMLQEEPSQLALGNAAHSGELHRVVVRRASTDDPIFNEHEPTHSASSLCAN
jgi:hypothetical protein